MAKDQQLGWVERIATKLRLLPQPPVARGEEPERVAPFGDLAAYPPFEKWDHWVEYDAKRWPSEKITRAYTIVPTTCFNCEAACGLIAYVDKETGEIVKFQGNPYHPASRGRNCAKGPATINQITDPQRILYPLKRDGPRGSGKWKQVSWEEAVSDIASHMRKALQENRHNEIMYHVGRPGHEGFMDWVLKAWGVDGHNSHTNVCSSGARTGYALWQKFDRPSPDFANARFILLISAHLESGHYFNPHAQRIIEAKEKGAKIAVFDPRLSNTASMCDFWLPTYPGSEAAVLLAIAKIILDEGMYNKKFLEEWTNWETYLQELHPSRPVEFDQFIEVLKTDYGEFTLEFAAQEAKIDTDVLPDIARRIGEAGTRFAYHNWRSASSGNLGGWQTARCLHFLAVLVGAVGTLGGTSPNGWHKFKPKIHTTPPPHQQWNELEWPIEYPLSHYEMGFLLPHLIKEGLGKLAVYFTRVLNPVWTHPDGFTWIEVLSNPELVGLHVSLTPTWNETAYYADYVLPMGHAAERHDINSYETHMAIWIAFRQPVQREALRRKGKSVTSTFETNIGDVWEEDEFWIDLSWQIDPDGSLGIRKHFESPNQPGQKISVEEYYSTIFENIPTLVTAAREKGLTPLDYMRRVGAFEVESKSIGKHLTIVDASKGEIDPKTRLLHVNGKIAGVQLSDGEVVQGFPTPSCKQEIYSTTMKEWGWPEYTTPGYIKSHIHWENMKEENEICLVPTFRLPTLIHSRSGNSKWLAEISHTNPVWMHPKTAARLNLETGNLIRVTTDIGYFVNKVWVTEGIRPDIVACSHHNGRWRREVDPLNNVWATNTVNVRPVKTEWKLRHLRGVNPIRSSDPDTSRIWWSEAGVHQNITFPVHPDPISGMHCWHQKVKISPAFPDDHYGDIFVNTKKSTEIFKEWLKLTKPGPGPDGLRRPRWLKRPVTPDPSMYIYKK